MTERIRGRKLQEIRNRVLSKNPLCVECLKKDRIKIATQIDHIIPLYKGGLEHDSNRQTLCDECHEAKTITERGQTLKPQHPQGLDWV